MEKRQTRWVLVIPGILSFSFMLLALLFKIIRAAQGDNASAVVVGVAMPVVIGLAIVIVPVVLIIRLGNKRYRRAMAKLQSQYPHVYYAWDFRYGSRLLTSDKRVVSIWRVRRKKLEQEASWQRGAVTIKQATVPISRAAIVPGIVFTDPHNKLRRLAVSNKVTARIKPIDYSAFLPYIQ